PVSRSQWNTWRKVILPDLSKKSSKKRAGRAMNGHVLRLKRHHDARWGMLGAGGDRGHSKGGIQGMGRRGSLRRCCQGQGIIEREHEGVEPVAGARRRVH